MYDLFPKGDLDASGGESRLSEIIPRNLLCKKCGAYRAGLYPTAPPLVRLHLKHQALTQMGLPFLVMHDSLFELLGAQISEAVTTRCSTSPKSTLRNGDQYRTVLLPPDAHTFLRVPGWYHDTACDACGARGGYVSDDAYYVLSARQMERAVLVSDSWRIAVTDEMRNAIISRFTSKRLAWSKIPVYDKPLPQNRIPEDGLGPALPSPFPPPPKMPNAPRMPKKPRGGLS